MKRALMINAAIDTAPASNQYLESMRGINAR
jgi:hypothetical protein